MASDLQQKALDYHRFPKAGKLTISPTKPMETQSDLALAYSPGVAHPCLAIAEDENQAASLTARGNLVGVVTNGTAVLGLGAIGPLASKPVMEGKAVLFKKFAGVDVFDIELNERDPEKLVDIIAAMEPTFGGINLEDIKAPECFIVEKLCRERMNIPVFHDDQHGTAICVAAAVYNALRVVGKDIGKVKLAACGAGAAALACLKLLVSLGLPKENIVVSDIHGVVYEGREVEMDPYKSEFAVDTNMRTLSEAVKDADIFLGCSGPGALTKDMVATMGERPIILALANPTPEILPEEVREVRPDAIIATGRSDYPNQVNNVLCFPYLFRGALDVGATEINEDMKIAAVKAIADLAQAEQSDIVTKAYGGAALSFGPEYLIPTPFDPRLYVEVAYAVAKAAMDSGVAARPVDSLELYREKLRNFIYRTRFVMKPVFDKARKQLMRVAYAEGEDERVLSAVQTVVDEGLALPILVGRRKVIEFRIEKMKLRLKLDRDFQLVDPEDDPRYREYWQAYHAIREREGVDPDTARAHIRTNTTIIGAMMVHLGHADALVCGTYGKYSKHFNRVSGIIPLRDGVRHASALHLLVSNDRALFFSDTQVREQHTAEELAELTILAADEVKRFGIEPKVALISYSNFGSADVPSARKAQAALKIINRLAPELSVEGEMKADSALVPEIRNTIFPNSRMEGAANLLIMPDLDSANISYNIAKSLGNGIAVGPILIGMSKSVHITVPSVTVRGLVNITAIAAVDAQDHQAGTMMHGLASRKKRIKGDG
ncbi:NADP-dependent malic enzyme [Sneathiella chinensis]|uniref:Bifunctional malic enzyme oxidoreductase/phosphotransacetylase n=1 Tax=Sneathiella chinensis TaxID=349750 RepID=A0ABQ5U7U1_9PROT|nr:NADP-dependent malic enzyme [Sneathiella chinensis]GLQ07738.1 bifunctional malic enzyme oxidoreductase/phosphotransacetylase [Sneathiella chinensis]